MDTNRVQNMQIDNKPSKTKLHLVGYLPIQYYKDAQYHEHKKKYIYI